MFSGYGGQWCERRSSGRDRKAKMPPAKERRGRGDWSVEEIDIDTFDTYILCPHSTWKELSQEAKAVLRTKLGRTDDR